MSPKIANKYCPDPERLRSGMRRGAAGCVAMPTHRLADTERTGLMRGEATLFMGVTGGITAGDFGLSRPQGRSDDRRHKAPSCPDAGGDS